jgi:hypothetical protein
MTQGRLLALIPVVFLYRWRPDIARPDGLSSIGIFSMLLMIRRIS